jgi:hypothetical protein
VRFLKLLLFIALLIPLSAFAGRLMSISGSEKTRESYTILALHFDKRVPYTVQELDGGTKLKLTIPGGDVDQAALKELRALKNDLITSTSVFPTENGLILEFSFKGEVRPNVWETRNPFSLVLDISVLEKPKASLKPKSTSTITATPKQQQRKFVPAGAQSRRTNKEVEQHTAKQPSSTAAHQEKSGQSEKKSASNAADLTAETHFYKGLSLHRDGQLVKALGHFREARKDPHLFAKATAEIANIYHQLGRSEDEVAAWEEVFAKVRETGHQFLDEQGSEIIPLEAYEGSDHQAGDHLDSDSGEAVSSGVSPFILYPLIAVIMLMMGAVFMLYKKVAQLRLIVGGHGTIPEPAEEKPMPEPELPPEIPEPEPATESTEEVPIEEEAVPWGDAEEESSRPAEETAMEVISLSEQGFSIQEIAEKLGLGQDEVRLILNLQREEKAAAE